MEGLLQLLASLIAIGIVFKLIAAILVGALARFLLPGKDDIGWGMTILAGFLGGWVYDLVGRIAGFVKPGTDGGLLGAIIGAMALVGALRLWKRAKAGGTPSSPPGA